MVRSRFFKYPLTTFCRNVVRPRLQRSVARFSGSKGEGDGEQRSAGLGPFTQIGSYVDNLPSTPYRPWQTVAWAEGERQGSVDTPWPLPNYLRLRRQQYRASRSTGESRPLLRMCTPVTLRHGMSPITGIVAHNGRGYGRLSHITEVRSAWPSDGRHAKRVCCFQDVGDYCRSRVIVYIMPQSG